MSPKLPLKEGSPKIWLTESLLSFPILSIESVSASGKLPLTYFFETQEVNKLSTKNIKKGFILFFLNPRKEKLDLIYNKIAEQSKDLFYFKKNQINDIEIFRDFFQINLIIILWYMRLKNLNHKYSEYLIKKFIKDMEGMIIELGGSETSLRKKIRTIVENFYGRLYAYSGLFDKIENLNQKQIIRIISKNFSKKIDIEIIQKYLKINILNFKKMDLTDFWELKFFYGRKVF